MSRSPQARCAPASTGRAGASPGSRAAVSSGTTAGSEMGRTDGLKMYRTIPPGSPQLYCGLPTTVFSCTVGKKGCVGLKYPRSGDTAGSNKNMWGYTGGEWGHPAQPTSSVVALPRTPAATYPTPVMALGWQVTNWAIQGCKAKLRRSPSPGGGFEIKLGISTFVRSRLGGRGYVANPSSRE